MRAFHEAAEEACNEYFLLAARLFACPAESLIRTDASDESHTRTDESDDALCMNPAVTGTAFCDDGHPLPSPRPSSVCAGLRGVPWWLTVDAPDDPEQARVHYDGARSLTELQCERLATALKREPAAIVPTPSALALAMGVIRMNAIGVCVDSSSAEGGIAAGLGLFDLLGRVNHSCLPNARLESVTGEREAATATLAANRDIEIGEEVLIDYLSNFKGSAAEKRAHLTEQYRFKCRCELCAHDDEAES